MIESQRQSSPLDWNQLSMKEKAAYIRVGVANGYKDIDSIRGMYNEFKKGGKKETVNSKQLFERNLEKSLQGYSRYNTPQWKEYFTKLADKESSYRENVRNSIGAKGYFQLMPANRTATWNTPTQQFEQFYKLLDSNMAYLRKNMTEEDLKKADALGIDIYGLMAGAHLGGAKGVLNALRGIKNASDSNGSSVVDYMLTFSQSNKPRVPVKNQKLYFDNLQNQNTPYYQSPLHTNEDTVQEIMPLNNEAVQQALPEDKIVYETTMPELVVEAPRQKPFNPFALQNDIQQVAPALSKIVEAPVIEPITNKIGNKNINIGTLLQQDIDSYILRNQLLNDGRLDQERLKKDLYDMQFYRNMAAMGGKQKYDEFAEGGSKRTASTVSNLWQNVSSYFTGKEPSYPRSQYRPTNSSDNNAVYYTIPELRYDVARNISHIPLTKEPLTSFDAVYNTHKGGIPRQMDSVNLGNYKVDTGKDDRGRYISFYDKYDWNMLEQLGFGGRPFEIYDRIYEDEWPVYINNIDGITFAEGGNTNNSWTMEDEAGYRAWRESLPDNLRHTNDNIYDMRAAYKSGAQPQLYDDGYYHLPSRDPRTGMSLKSPIHPTHTLATFADGLMGYHPYTKNGKEYTDTWEGNEKLRQRIFPEKPDIPYIFAEGGNLFGKEGDEDHIYETEKSNMPELVVTAPRKYIAGYDENGNPIYTENSFESMGYTPVNNAAEYRKGIQAMEEFTKPKYTDDIVKAAQIGIGLPLAVTTAPATVGPLWEGLTPAMEVMARPLTTTAKVAPRVLPQASKALPYTEMADRGIMGVLGTKGMWNAGKGWYEGEIPWYQAVPQMGLSGLMMADAAPLVSKGIKPLFRKDFADFNTMIKRMNSEVSYEGTNPFKDGRMTGFRKWALDNGATPQRITEVEAELSPDNWKALKEYTIDNEGPSGYAAGEDRIYMNQNEFEFNQVFPHEVEHRLLEKLFGDRRSSISAKEIMEAFDSNAPMWKLKEDGTGMGPYFYERDFEELLPRFTQIKNALGIKKARALTEAELRKAYKMLKEGKIIDNNMTEFFEGIKDWKAAAKLSGKALSATGVAGATVNNNRQ